MVFNLEQNPSKTCWDFIIKKSGSSPYFLFMAAPAEALTKYRAKAGAAGRNRTGTVYATTGF